MKAWIVSRRMKAGREEDFRQDWAGGDTPDGMTAAYLLQRDDDPRETVSVSLWESPQKLQTYREGGVARSRNDVLSGDIEGTESSHSYDAFEASDLQKSGRSKKLLAPAGVGVAGVGAYLVARTLRGRNQSLAEKSHLNVVGTGASTVIQKSRGKKRWLLPALLVPLGGGGFFLIRKLRGGNKEADTWERWDQDASSTSTPPITESYLHSQPVQPAGTGSATVIQPSQPAEAHAAMASPSSSPAATPAGTQSQPEQPVASRSMAASQAGTRVRDLMTPAPETVDYDADIAVAAEKMRRLNVGALPVMADGQLSGIITDRDIAMTTTDSKAPGKISVLDRMTAAPVTISPDMSMQEASKLMAGHQVRRLPVVEGNKLVGIISLGDLAADGADHQ
ncbi:MAG: CBS domain-containing protein [Dehalococcoidia bacterium]